MTPKPPCVVIADDLTGACDTGVHFAREGFPTFVTFGAPCALEGPGGIPVINTQSRSQAVVEAVARVERAAASAPPGSLLYKKLDSTLFGHVAAELDAALRAGRRSSVVLAPAYPLLGRTVRDGTLYVNGEARQAIAPLLGTTLKLVSTLDAALAEPGSVFLPDAATTEELRTIAQSAVEYRDRLVLAGSGGLARELAALLAAHTRIAPHATPALPGRTGHVVVFAGSHNPVTVSQVERIRATRRLDCRVRTIRLSEGTRHKEIWRRMAVNARAILFCGGESAQLVCGTLGVTGISLAAEILPGVPWGTLSGGCCDGVPVATKAGGFGHPDCLLEVARFFLEP